MSDSPNRLSQFWQELKRRNVVGVITVYTGAAFVILSLVDMVREPFELPNWSFKLVVVLLSIRLILAVILSWIYDIHPVGGIVKTKPADELKDEAPKSSKGWKIASYISFVVIVGLIVLNIIPRAGNKEVLDKSIAVLPFQNDSPDEEKMYFINGTMDAILDNLCKIADLRVVSRNSVEQYRDNPKPTPVVAEEMNVSYVLEGSGHRDGNKVRLFVQLLDGKKDQHLWSKSYDADIEEIFSMQSEIAQLVAREIEAIITPQEKELIERIPTSNLVAHEFYQKGLEEHWEYWLDNDSREALRNAERQYEYALDYDSTFSLAYIGLAKVYWDRNYWKEYFTEYFMDSAMSLVDKALSFDPQQSEAYVLRGSYFYQVGDINASIEAYNRASSLNPNNLSAYSGLADVYFSRDMILEISNRHKALLLNREANELPSLIRSLGYAYSSAGFPDIWESYMKEALELDGDSVTYLSGMIFGG
jgi:TolB-like protein